MSVLDVLPARLVLHPTGSQVAVESGDAFALGELPEVAPSEEHQALAWAEAWKQRRVEARRRKDFKESDRIRDLLKAAGWEVRDNRDGTVEVRKL